MKKHNLEIHKRKHNLIMRKVVTEDMIVFGCYDLETWYGQMVLDMLIENALDEQGEDSYNAKKETQYVPSRGY